MRGKAVVGDPRGLCVRCGCGGGGSLRGEEEADVRSAPLVYDRLEVRHRGVAFAAAHDA